MNWIILILAGLMEVGFTFCLGKTKTSTGHELAMWWLGFLAALASSMYLMAKASEKLPIGTVYPVWTGIGAVGAVVVGIVFFQEPAICIDTAVSRNPIQITVGQHPLCQWTECNDSLALFLCRLF